MIVRSSFNPQIQVDIDPFDMNPLLQDAKQASPTIVAMALREGPPPTLFESGDLPPFVASGVDPQVLTRLPYTARHAAALETLPGVVLQWIEEFRSNPDAVIETQGLHDYQRRMRRWLSGLDAPKNAEADDAPDIDAMYATMFAGDEADRRVKRDTINAATETFYKARRR